MSHQVALFHDSIYDALAADVAAIGGIKKAAAMLWPTNSDAAGRLRACLSAEHAQKLDPEEVMTLKRLARDVGSTATVAYESQMLGYDVEWIKADDAHAELQRQFNDSVKMLERIGQMMKGRS